MRWSNRNTEELCLPSTARTSAGVQTEPFYVHSGVQTLDTDNPTVTEAKSTRGSGNLAATASISPGASAALHSPNPRRYVSLKVQTDSEMWMTEAAGLAVKPVSVPMTDELTAVNQTSEVGRSLSPMELDSIPGSRHASSSPTVSPKETETAATPCKRKSLPASPTSSIASSSGAQDMQLSPANSRSSSTIFKATESVSALSTTVASQASNYDITPFVGAQHIRAQRSTALETFSHHPRPETDPQKLVMASNLDSLQRNQQRQLTSVSLHSRAPARVRYCIYRWPMIECACVFSQLPAIPGSKSISPTASSILSTSLSKDQDTEYSPRDPLFNPSSIPPEDWQLYPNIAQLFGVSSQIYSNAVASSSKVTLERAHNSHSSLDSVNAEPIVSVRASEKSPAKPAQAINGTERAFSTEEAELSSMHSYSISIIGLNTSHRSWRYICCIQQPTHVPATLKRDAASGRD